MNPDVILQAISDNPLTAAAVGGALAAIVGFFKPIMAALQAALIRRINQAYADDSGEGSHEDCIRRTAESVRRSTRVPLPQNYVEEHVRRTVSEPPEQTQPPL